MDYYGCRDCGYTQYYFPYCNICKQYFQVKRRKKKKLQAPVQDLKLSSDPGKFKFSAKGLTNSGLPVYECHYCGDDIIGNAVTRDHVIPKAKGGGSSDNLVPACRRCNMRKGNMDYHKFLELLQKERAQI